MSVSRRDDGKLNNLGYHQGRTRKCSPEHQETCLAVRIIGIRDARGKIIPENFCGLGEGDPVLLQVGRSLARIPIEEHSLES